MKVQSLEGLLETLAERARQVEAAHGKHPEEVSTEAFVHHDLAADAEGLADGITSGEEDPATIAGLPPSVTVHWMEVVPAG